MMGRQARHTGILVTAMTFLAVLALAQGVHAVPILGSKVINFNVTGNNTSLALVTQFTLTDVELGSGSGDFTSGPPPGTALPDMIITLPFAPPFTFMQAGFGTAMFTTLLQDSFNGVAHTRSLAFTGTTTDPGFAPDFGGFDPTSASLVFSFTQAGGPGNSLSGSASLATPNQLIVNAVPEPGTIALLSTGLACMLGYGYWRRRQD